ncbi:MAG: TetR/AcrR family transcriptional regulator [Parvibaculum sp.]|nr:TetR/AcrR family transcriptional regulator [Parvibaculum sp.]
MSAEAKTSPAETRRNAQREGLLDAASEMLMHGGPDAISLRKLATKVGASTMAVYTAFGGKEGLITALFEEAFDRLAAAQNAAVRDPEPILWLANLSRAYRDFALKNPSYYALMISATLPVPDALRHNEPATCEPAARSIARHPSYQNLLDAIEACIAEGSMPGDADPAIIADALWATVHGLCSLELAGFHLSAEDAEKRFGVAAGAVMRGLLTPKGLKKYESFSRRR